MLVCYHIQSVADANGNVLKRIINTAFSGHFVYLIIVTSLHWHFVILKITLIIQYFRKLELNNSSQSKHCEGGWDFIVCLGLHSFTIILYISSSYLPIKF